MQWISHLNVKQEIGLKQIMNHEEIIIPVALNLERQW